MTTLLKLFFLVLLLIPHGVHADEYVFNPGEEIHFKIMQMGLKAGDATLKFVGPTVINEVDTVLIEFTADGFNFYDNEKIYVDPTSFKPLTVIRDLNIFGKKEKIVETYFPQDNKILIEKTVGSKVINQVLTKQGEIDNIYGFIYRFRQEGEFKVGNKTDIVLPTKDFKIVITKKVKVAAAGKDFESYYLESQPAGYKIWLDASDKRLPLRISGAIGLANTVMVLKGYKE